MKVKLIVKDKGSWSIANRHAVKAAAEWAVERFEMEDYGRVTIRLTDADDGHDGSMVYLGDDQFIVFLNPQLSRNKMFEIIFHEFTHVKQVIFDGFRLNEYEDCAEWKGRNIAYHEDKNYWTVPWEVEARKLGRKLRKEYTKCS
jgi:hypothetical protein